MISPVNGAFKLRPKTFNSIGMNVTATKLTFPMANSFVNMPKHRNFVVAVRFIGSNYSIGLLMQTNADIVRCNRLRLLPVNALRR